MTAIGVDTHKATLAACAIDELGRAIDEATFGNDPAGYLAFIAWAYSIEPEATIGIEGSSSFGAPLARAVQTAGHCVREVPPHLSRFERRRTRRPGKSDPGDALAIARVTARETNLPPIRLPDRTRSVSSLRPEKISSARRLVRETGCTRTCGSSCQAAAGRSRTSSRLVIGRWSGASSVATQPSKGSLLVRSSTAYFVLSVSATCSRVGSRPSSMVIRSGRCRVRVRSLSPGLSPRPVTCGASAPPTPSRPWPESRPSRPVRVRSSGCVSTAAATASSTGQCM